MATEDDLADISITLVGPFGVRQRGVPVADVELGSRKARTLMKFLATERTRTVSASRIVEVLWGDQPPRRARDNVATLVSRLRHRLGVAAIEGGRDGYRLGQSVQVDLDLVRAWAQESESRLAGGEPGLALAAAARAADLLSRAGGPEDEPMNGDWAEPVRTEIRDLDTRTATVRAAAALAVGDLRMARQAAETVVAVDPYGEVARQILMRALAGMGEPARALAVFAELRERLDQDLGTEPTAETRAVHLAILREDSSASATTRRHRNESGAETLGLVGRDQEFRCLRSAWNAASAGRPAQVLVVGDPGIGKTRLCDELAAMAAATGGTVLQARCYEAERSLFLQPIVEAIGAAFRGLSPGVVQAAAGESATTLAGLIPEAAAVLGIGPSHERSSAQVERRRAFEALTGFLRRLSVPAPVLLVLDDLQNAGRATSELLHYLGRHLSGSRVLVVASVRDGEGARLLDALSEVAARVNLGPLPAAAVARLSAAAGQAELSDKILAMTRGHALFVVETLRGLTAGEVGVPGSLHDAVLARVRRAGREVEDLLRAASVLGAAFDAATVAGLLAETLPVVLARCQSAVEARLLVVAGAEYEFANDLVREVVYASTAVPIRLAYHRLAANLLTDRPEAVALHADAAGDWSRAARAWLLAGEQAGQRFAGEDAEELLSRSLRAAERVGDREIRGRAMLARARALSARGAYREAMSDLWAALATALEVADQRLEMLVRRALGGDTPIALGLPIIEVTEHLERGLQIATSLGDHAMEADLQAWLAILACNGLRFGDALEHSDRAVAAARASGDDRALAAALDGRKTSVAYLGELAELRPVLAELEPLLRRLGDQFLLHWTMFESGFPAVAAGDWPQAAAHFQEALEANRRHGFLAYEAWLVAHLSWLARLQGDYPTALTLGRRAVQLSRQMPHAWCGAVAAAMLGSALLETGDRAQAISVLEQGCELAGVDGSEAYLIRCLAPLAEGSRSPTVLREADDMVARIAAPAGSAWLVGDGAYLGVARAWLDAGDPERARAVLSPVLVAAARIPWVAPLAAGSLVDGLALEQLGRTEDSRAALTRAAELARRHGLVPVAGIAMAALR